jgi:hypothetical protein
MDQASAEVVPELTEKVKAICAKYLQVPGRYRCQNCPIQGECSRLCRMDIRNASVYGDAVRAVNAAAEEATA